MTEEEADTVERGISAAMRSAEAAMRDPRCSRETRIEILGAIEHLAAALAALGRTRH